MAKTPTPTPLSLEEQMAANRASLAADTAPPPVELVEAALGALKSDRPLSVVLVDLAWIQARMEDDDPAKLRISQFLSVTTAVGRLLADRLKTMTLVAAPDPEPQPAPAAAPEPAPTGPAGIAEPTPADPAAATPTAGPAPAGA